MSNHRKPHVHGVYEDAAALAVHGRGHAFGIIIHVLSERVADARESLTSACNALDKAERSRARDKEDRIYDARQAMSVASHECDEAQHTLNVYKTARFLSGMARGRMVHAGRSAERYETFLAFLRNVDEGRVEGMEHHMETVAYNRAWRDIMSRKDGGDA